MISIGVPAVMKCEEKGCEATVPCELALMGAGGFAFRPLQADDMEKWQVVLPMGPAGLGAPFATRCPMHKTRVTPVQASLKPNGKVVGHG